uniref:Putative lateral signaling target protein 2 n=1 Tax=Culex tarsalis TaxID=7177 RepID=A0A1Q3EWU2_CULTA
MDKSGDGGGGGDSRDGGPSPSTSSGPSIGCGSAGTSSSSGAAATVVGSPMTLNVTTTTGGSFSVVVDGENSVENLKKIISKKLKVSKDRICLLHRERELHDGSLRDNGLMDGSKLILTPNVETGLLAQRAENTVMQALESLNDNQVNDFLSGKSPLNLSVRLGDHMMLIQLQLSTLNPSSASGSRSKTHKSRTAITAGPSSGSSSGTSSAAAVPSSSSGTTSSRRTAGSIPIGFRRVSESRSLVERVGESQTLTRQDIENIHSIVKNLAESDNATVASVTEASEQSPIKSLSNLVSSSINSSSNGPELDPISANLTSCLCKRLDTNDNNSCESNCLSRSSVPEPSTSSASLHRTAQNPIARHKSKVQTLKKHISFESSSAVTRIEPDQVQGPVTAPSSPQPGPSRVLDPNSVVENPALAEASRNLTQTLRKLSKRVFTSSSKSSSDSASTQAQEAAAAGRSAATSAVNSGAVIESMKHHGKGIYSGTFSGTLNPALQDKFGRPKRDISTIIHILNDLLSAAPQCARSGTKIYFEPSAAAAAGGSGMQAAGSGSSSGGSTGGGAATFTTPVAAPSPRLVSRCMPTPIQTKKFPSNGTITSHHHQQRVAASGLTATPPPQAPSPAVKIQCKCGHPLLTPTGPAAQCQRCAAELENSKTKSKLDSLRLIMQQKKERREARKQKCAPYPVQAAAPTLAVPTLNLQPSSASGSLRPQPTLAPIPSDSPAATASAIVGEQPSATSTNTSSSNSAAGSATATATATAAATTTTAETAAAQSHQLVEEVDTVA